ncbi:hypothetical protein [Brachybacterium nesterenkovii]|uniref:hypothetical protein n=1 Tax=Brachybacterium nesterenkovii TaxID=47847 RepID=UPI00321BFD65
MAFRKLSKPARINAGDPTISIGLSGNGRQAFLALSRGARMLLGDPVAVYLEWDDEASLMRIVASSLEDPAAYKITGSTSLISVTRVLRDLDLTPRHTMRFPVRRDSRLSVVADLTPLVEAPTLRTVAA